MIGNFSVSRSIVRSSTSTEKIHPVTCQCPKFQFPRPTFLLGRVFCSVRWHIGGLESTAFPLGREPKEGWVRSCVLTLMLFDKLSSTNANEANYSSTGNPSLGPSFKGTAGLEERGQASPSLVLREPGFQLLVVQLPGLFVAARQGHGHQISRMGIPVHEVQVLVPHPHEVHHILRVAFGFEP